MIKKSLAIVTILIMLLTSFIVIADNSEFIKNGGFEEYKADGSMLAWSAGGLAFGKDISLSETDIHGGKKSVKIVTEAESVFVSQAISNLIATEKYELSFYYKVPKQNGNGLAVKCEFRDYDTAGKVTLLTEKDFQQEVGSSTGKAWEKFTLSFVAPGNAATVLIRFYGGGEVWIDDVSVTGKLASGAKEATAPKTVSKGNSDNKQSEHIKNGSFEEQKSDGKVNDWVVGNGFEVSASDKVSGKNSLKVLTEENQVLSAQPLNNLVAGTKYSVKLNYKAVKLSGTGAAIKLEFRDYDEDGNMTTLTEHDFQRDIQNKSKNTWQEHSFDFIAPGNAATFIIRFYGGGEAYFDDISIIGETLIKEDKVKMVIKEPVAGAVNLIKNSSFDTDTGWSAYKGWDGGSVSLIDDGYEGKGIKVSSNEPLSYPWAAITINNVLEGGEYQVSAYLNTKSVETGNAAFKYEFYSNETPSSESWMKGAMTVNFSNYSEWTRVANTFKVPEGCKSIKLYLRLMANYGELYWDNVECYMTKATPKFKFETDQFFYYTGADRGKIFLNEYLDYKSPKGSTVDFKIEDIDGNAIYSALNIPMDGYASSEFDVSLLKNKESAYTVKYLCKNADKTVIEEGQDVIYRYDRPTKLDENGIYIKDGKPFFPIIGYHVELQKEDYDYCKAAGINVIQFFPSAANMSVVKAKLDEIYKNGFMVFIALYSGMKPAGHPENEVATKKIVEAVKNHPATFGYMVMDEPLGNNCSVEDLRNSYKIIRDIDKEHPVYMVEGGEHIADYSLVGKCVDILAADPYPSGLADESTYISEKIEKAKQAVGYKKPVYCINQANKILTYQPDSNDIIHAAYQAVYAGAEGIGYYDVRDFYKYNNGAYEHIWDRVCWDGVKYFGEIKEDVFNAFILNKYPVLNEKKEDGLWWKIYIKDSKAHAVILNRGDAKTANIPLESFDGSIKISEYSAVADKISQMPAITGNGNLSLTLEHGKCVVYEIAPTSLVDFSSLKECAFMDLTNFPWARAQINLVDQKGIVNHTGFRTFSPEAKITRADFAVFLIKTLGLDGNSSENFADVNPEAYYAKEIAIGKALGILKGTGDNSYNPYAEISRQDMMTICARGMIYASKLSAEGNKEDVSIFSDASEIADYALTSVAAMVKEGIVKGNADKTVNPKGNATRAEAAVIMERILRK